MKRFETPGNVMKSLLQEIVQALSIEKLISLRECFHSFSLDSTWGTIISVELIPNNSSAIV